MDAISKPLISEHLQRKNQLKFFYRISWDKNNNTFVESQTIFNRLDDKRNWISEWAKIKKSIQENFVKKLKSDDNKNSVLIVFWNGCNI
jgi:hypothetical protein